jgi:antitoxin VapB
MPLYIKDDATAEMVAHLARLRGTTKQNAVKLAVEAELKRASDATPMRDRLQDLWTKNPMPPRTGRPADKTFFDDLSGDL